MFRYFDNYTLRDSLMYGSLVEFFFQKVLWSWLSAHYREIFIYEFLINITVIKVLSVIGIMPLTYSCMGLFQRSIAITNIRRNRGDSDTQSLK